MELEQNLLVAAVEKTSMKIFGVGDVGVKLLAELGATEFSAAALVAVNTDAASLHASAAPLKFHIQNKLLRGLGSGGDAERSRALAEEQFCALKSACEDTSVVFILAGLGGGAGSGISPVLARAAREAGALVIAFVTLPFDSEGGHRGAQARQSFEQLKAAADGVICLAGDKIFGVIDENSGLLEILRAADRLLLDGLRGVWQLLHRRDFVFVPVNLDSLRAFFQERHAENSFAHVEGVGAARSREVVEKIISHPLLDAGRALAEAEAVLVNLTAGKNLTMAEVNRVMAEVKRQCGRAQIVFGAAMDGALADRLCVTIIAARPNAPAKAGENSRPAAVRGGFTGGHTSPMVASALGGSRPRRPGTKPVQGQLPLTVVSRGRFDKSEPTLHQGEDLDVPTFLRRGVVLN